MHQCTRPTGVHNVVAAVERGFFFLPLSFFVVRFIG